MNEYSATRGSRGELATCKSRRGIACVASVSVPFRTKERGGRIKTFFLRSETKRKCLLRRLTQYHVITPCKRIQHCLGFWIPCHGFRNLDFNRQWDSVFLELYSEFQSPGFRNADSLSLGECKQAKNTLTTTFKYFIFLTWEASAIFVTLALSSVISSTNIYRQTNKKINK